MSVLHQLTTPVERTGVGLHRGQTTTVRLCPAPLTAGLHFVRMDLPTHPTIPACLDTVSRTLLSTELGTDEVTVRTVEHLLAALSAQAIAAARIEVDGPEIPLLDGSAQDWVSAIAAAQPTPAQLEAPIPWPLDRALTIQEKDAFVSAIPAPELCFTYGIDFPQYGPIGSQWQTWYPGREDFAGAIAPARTFGFADQIEALRQQGLIQGGSLENALVCDREKWLNPPLRFANEPARHKLLDLVGDLSLLGGKLPCAHIVAYKASHRLHIQFAQVLKAHQLNQETLGR